MCLKNYLFKILNFLDMVESKVLTELILDISFCYYIKLSEVMNIHFPFFLGMQGYEITYKQTLCENLEKINWNKTGNFLLPKWRFLTGCVTNFLLRNLPFKICIVIEIYRQIEYNSTKISKCYRVFFSDGAIQWEKPHISCCSDFALNKVIFFFRSSRMYGDSFFLLFLSTHANGRTFCLRYSWRPSLENKHFHYADATENNTEPLCLALPE